MREKMGEKTPEIFEKKIIFSKSVIFHFSKFKKNVVFKTNILKFHYLKRSNFFKN